MKPPLSKAAIRESAHVYTDPEWTAKLLERFAKFDPASPLSDLAARLLVANGAVREQ